MKGSVSGGILSRTLFPRFFEGFCERVILPDFFKPGGKLACGTFVPYEHKIFMTVFVSKDGPVIRSRSHDHLVKNAELVMPLRKGRATFL